MLEIRPGERYNTDRQVEETLSWVKDQPRFIGTANTYEALFFCKTLTAATTTFQIHSPGRTPKTHKEPPSELHRRHSSFALRQKTPPKQY